jgi:hypothetical protein
LTYTTAADRIDRFYSPKSHNSNNNNNNNNKGKIPVPKHHTMKAYRRGGGKIHGIIISGGERSAPFFAKGVKKFPGTHKIGDLVDT